MDQNKLTQLLQGYLAKTLQQNEKDRLDAFVADHTNQQMVIDVLEKLLHGDGRTEPYDKERFLPIFNDIMSVQPIAASSLPPHPAASRPAHRIHFLKTAWLRYAAAAVILLGIGIYFWNIRSGEQPGRQADPSSFKNDILPGGNKAILTLADGSVIVLDSAVTGNLAQQGASVVKKSADGQIIYTIGSDTPAQPVVFNTMSTPKGGQYRLLLPDGSRVWLNAASSITYPTAFIGKERKVSITGEVYFEVAKDPLKPFTVKTYKDEITVVGTSFNVNSYKDEPIIKTSLLEGVIRIDSKVLKPGQACVDGRIVKTNLEQDMAWKNGVFNFDGKGLEEVMRRLSRWYDIEVVYPNGVPEIEFGGGLKCDLNLSQILKALESSEVHFQLEGRRLMVKP